MSYYEQPGRTTSVDTNGKQTVTVTFVGTEEAPRPGGLSGSVKSKTVTKSEAGQIRTQYQIELDAGSTGGATGFDGSTFEVVASVRTVPIEAHPNFAEQYLTAADKKKIKDAIQVPDRSPSFDDATDPKRAISLYGYLINGVESYYVPSLIVRKTYQASSPPSSAKVGKIASPGVSIPGTPQGATFLLINVSARGSSGAYTVTEEYEMSGEGGWDTFLYGS
jgi:hypothetical protein